MQEKFLPIGTVVTLKEATKKIMIVGYLPMNEKNELFDYSACMFPEGIIDAKEGLAFNHDQIEKIQQMGLITDEYKKLNDGMKNIIKDVDKLQNIKLPDKPN